MTRAMTSRHAGTDPVGYGLALVLVALALLLSGCSRDDRDWESARAIDTVAAYEQFVRLYPHSEHIAEAERRIAGFSDEVVLTETEPSVAGIDAEPDATLAEPADPENPRVPDSEVAADTTATEPAPGRTVDAGPGDATGPGVLAEPSPGRTIAASPGDATGPGMLAEPAPDTNQETARETIIAAEPDSIPVVPSIDTTGPDPPSGSRTETAGGFLIQLGAFGAGEAAARRAWERYLSAHSDVLRGLEPQYEAGELADGVAVVRLRAGPVSLETARKVCERLTARDVPCIPVAR